MWLSHAIAKASSPTISKQDQNILAFNHVSIMMEKIVVRR